MPEPQPGLFAQGLSHHMHVEFAVNPAANIDALRDAITNARRVATGLVGPNVTWGFSPTLWSALSPGTLPETVKPLVEVRGKTGLVAPSTQWDIWAWCSGASAESVGATAATIVDALANVADLQLQLPAYTAPDSRDPTGFVDGTENPLPDEAYEVAVFPADSVGAGGSAVLVQKWVHNLTAFEALPLDEQEGVIGRTKQESIELPDGEIPMTSHVKRNTVLDAEGEERHIYRRNTPYNLGDEIGTQFIGATNDPDLMIEMLERMFGATEDGLIDMLATFSTVVNGSMYFVPAMSALTTAFAPLADDDEDDEPPADPHRLPTDGKLRIGSLRGYGVPTA